MEEILDDQFLEEKNRDGRKDKWFYFFLALLMIGSVVSTLMAWFEVESIVGSGPAMSIIGIIVASLAPAGQGRHVALLGLVPLVLSIFWLFMINLFSLSPTECKSIVPLSLSLASVLVLIAGVFIFSGYKG